MRLTFALFATCLILSAGTSLHAAPTPGFWELANRAFEIKAVSDKAIGLVYATDNQTIEYQTYDLKGKQLSGFCAEVVTIDPSGEGSANLTFVTESNGNVHLLWGVGRRETQLTVYTAVLGPAGNWIVRPSKISDQVYQALPKLFINEFRDRIQIITPSSASGITGLITQPSTVICLNLRHERQFVHRCEVEWYGQCMTLDSANRLHVLYTEQNDDTGASKPGTRLLYVVYDDPANDPPEWNAPESSYSPTMWPHGSPGEEVMRCPGSYDGLDPHLRLRGNGAVDISYTPASNFDVDYEIRQFTRPKPKHVIIKDKSAIKVRPQPILIQDADGFLLIDSKGRQTRMSNPNSKRTAARAPKLVELPPSTWKAPEPDPLSTTSGRWWNVTFSPDGRMILAEDDGRGELHVWGFPKCRLIKNLGSQDFFAFTSDGKSIVTMDLPEQDQPGPRELRFYDAKTLTLRRRVAIADNLLHGLDISPDARMLATANLKGEILLWDLDTLKLLDKLHDYGPGHCPGTSPKFSPDGKSLAVNTGRMIRVHNIETGKVREIPTWFDPTLGLSETEKWKKTSKAASPDCAWALPPQSRLIKLPFRPMFDDYDTRHFSPDGVLYARPNPDKNVIELWDMAAGKLVREVSIEKKLRGDWAAFTPSGRMLLTDCEDGSIASCGVRSGAPLGEITLSAAPQSRQ